jgi:beta-N-acetylhexosaminidase
MKAATLKQKIGQLFVIGFAGDALDRNHPISRDIAERNLGGVILFDRLLANGQDTNNIISGGQLKLLIEELQSHAEIPLLVAVDQEGGRVSRFSEKRGFPVTPTASELGLEPTLKLTTQSAKQTARMLQDVGINFNLAPVVDLNVYDQNPIIARYDRSFSAHVDEVIAHATAWIRAHRECGILSCLKHFPGHGSSRSDSHKGFVDITDTWQEIELQPYQKLQEKGLVDTIMLGHLFHRGFDENYPVTLSRSTIESQIRQGLGFDGPIISDDMQMKAITDHYGLEDACCRALAAGVDLIIIGNNLEHDPSILSKVVEAVISCIDEGTVSEKRINEAWERIQSLKQSLQTW